MKYANKSKKTTLALALSLLMLAGSASAGWAQDSSGRRADSRATQPEDTTETDGRMSMKGMMENCPMMSGGQMQGDQMQGGMRGGMMQGGMMRMMMQRMTSDPVQRSVMQVYVLPALGDSLGLSADQAERLEAAKNQFAEQRQEIQKKLRAQEQQLGETMKGEQPDLSRAEALLTGRAALEADAQMAALRAAAEMTGALSGNQREKLAALKPMQMHRAMMAGLSMKDMMQMMSAMEMSCPMMNGGMMNGGQMQSSQMQSEQMQPSSRNR